MLESTTMRSSSKVLQLCGILTVILNSSLTATASPESQPNFIIILTDDQGYNDLGCFGSQKILTPNLDRLANEGRKFTSFYVASSICTPSRAALLTGCYPKRIGMAGSVIFPQDSHGLHPDEVTIAETLKTAGYATACIGKWHLGHSDPLLPTRQGFDSYFGIPYSNDMSFPDNRNRPQLDLDEAWLKQDETATLWNTPLMEDGVIIELPVNQRTITRRYTNRAIEFIEQSHESPFLLYLAHSMPHIPLFVPEDAYDNDPTHAYKAVIQHLDSEIGRIMKVVDDLNLSENTFFIFTSDNGPWLKYGHHAGSAAPLRGGKFSTYEGGQRVPFIVRGPGVPEGTETDAIASSLDLLPTIAGLANADLTARGPIDGRDITDLMLGGSRSPRSEFLYYNAKGELEGLRQGAWKLLDTNRGLELYNLTDDISESTNQIEAFPRKAETLQSRMRELGKMIESNIRPNYQPPGKS
jgi:arylsulfatase A